MIPYIEWTHFSLGPLTIQVWGLMVALGFMLGAVASTRLAARRGLKPGAMWDALVWIIVGAFVMSRLFFVVFYEPAYYWMHPAEIVAVWQGGASMMGGYIGAVLAGAFFLHRRKLPFWKYLDAGIFGLPLGLFIGRIGCFLIHDHPGTATTFWLGVRYPDGIVRHDHGLYLSLNGLILFLVYLVLVRKKAREGVLTATFLVWEGVSRFILDFFRVYEGVGAETRYLGLTPAQYVAILMLAGGMVYFVKIMKKPATTTVGK